MAQKPKPNFRSYSPKRSGSQQPKPQQRNFLGEPIHSKKQSGSGGNSRKVHDTKGRNTQGTPQLVTSAFRDQKSG